MKKSIRLFCVLLAAMTVLCALPLSASAATYKSAKKLKSGTSLDLNGDGKKEKITYKFTYGEEYDDDYSGDYDNYQDKFVLTIGGKKKTFEFEPYYIYSPSKLIGVYYGDVNKDDDYIEIFAYYYSGESITMDFLDICDLYVFRYDGNKITKASGYFSGDGYNTDKNPIKLDGKGTIKLRCISRPLGGSYSYYSTNKLTDSFKIKKVEKYHTVPAAFKSKAKADFEMYTSNSRKSDTFTVKKGTTVTGIKSKVEGYGYNWIQLKTSSGETGWVCAGFQLGYYVFFPNNDIEPSDVFSFPDLKP